MPLGPQDPPSLQKKIFWSLLESLHPYRRRTNPPNRKKVMSRKWSHPEKPPPLTSRQSWTLSIDVRRMTYPRSTGYEPLTSGEPSSRERTSGEPTWRERSSIKPTWRERTSGEPTWRERTSMKPTWRERTSREPTWRERSSIKPTWRERSSMKPTWRERTSREPT